MMLFESLIFNLLPAAVGIMAVVLVFESCWRKCPPDKLMIVSGAELYSAQKDAEGIQARAKAEAEATRLKGESEGVAEKAHGEGVAAGIKAQAEAYNGMDNPYLLANRYIDIMPKVAEQVAKPLTAVDSIKMYGSGNAQKLVKETTSIVDQVASGLKDSTGIDLPSLLNGLISNPDIDADSAENSVE
ncbi:MAG: flotillin domain-containing protein [Collinsella aerofaciens]